MAGRSGGMGHQQAGAQQALDYNTVWSQTEVSNTTVYVGNVQHGTPDSVLSQYFGMYVVLATANKQQK